MDDDPALQAWAPLLWALQTALQADQHAGRHPSPQVSTEDHASAAEALAGKHAPQHSGPGRPDTTPGTADHAHTPSPGISQADTRADWRLDLARLAPPALQRLARRFGLDAFELGVLALCAAVEWRPAIAQACGRWHGERGRVWPTLGLAVGLLAGGRWTALGPTGRLRRWRLVDLAPGPGVAEARLSVDERVLHYLADRSFLDPRLAGLVHPVPRPEAARLPAALLGTQQRLVACWARAGGLSDCPVADCGDLGPELGERFAGAVCAALGLQLHRLAASDLPGNLAEREALARLWERESMLLNSALLVVVDASGAAEVQAHAGAFIDPLQSLVFTTGAAPALRRQRLRCAIPSPRAGDVDADLPWWQEALGAVADQLGPALAPVVAQFQVSDQALRQIATELAASQSLAPLASQLWDACRVQARGGLELLAQRIDARAGWDDLVLPEAQTQALRTMALHVRQRHRVHGDWGFAAKSGRGLGISALFCGASGTGKTLAAEVLANSLRLDLYRVDLSAMVSKYIGETQKNLRHLFDAAQASGAILLFDEADAIFGARSEVRDSLDRHANMDVAYLLQRVETYRGLAILTTNLKQAIDPAFLRRIRFVVNFPFPDDAARRGIWARAFPENMPRGALDVDRLARLNLSGGHIRNLALNAAFLATEDGEQVHMRHLLSAAQAEYAKLEKPLPRTEVGDWV